MLRLFLESADGLRMRRNGCPYDHLPFSKREYFLDIDVICLKWKGFWTVRKRLFSLAVINIQ